MIGASTLTRWKDLAQTGQTVEHTRIVILADALLSLQQDLAHERQRYAALQGTQQGLLDQVTAERQICQALQSRVDSLLADLRTRFSVFDRDFDEQARLRKLAACVIAWLDVPSDAGLVAIRHAVTDLATGIVEPQELSTGDQPQSLDISSPPPAEAQTLAGEVASGPVDEVPDDPT